VKAKLTALLVAAMTFGLGGLPASASPPSSNSLGEAVPLSAAKRTIRIDARTRYVNVTEHETIKFESNGSAFAIYFRGALYGLDLNQLAPPNALDHKVIVWVAPDPLYLR
jgi:Heavy-metal resistance protein CzcE